ncbi:molybdopterin-dependent oxidoreductase, partial [Allorhizocola rhizosphaerae]|uniref:molybdopterin-dependent oxidoreductase n=1 Tax=Allorhizocola rhizosphaerae TaxID=1872709 RepID=UPI0013C31A38
RDTNAILEAAARGRMGALVVAGVDPSDVEDPQLADEALDNVGFLVSLELRMSAVARRADVVFPVAAVAEKAGSFVNWEGRLRTFEQALETPNIGAALPDGRVLDAIAAQMGVSLHTGDVYAIRRELGSLPATLYTKPAPVYPREAPSSRTRLVTWPQLIDLGALLDGDEVLAGTARPSAVRLSKAWGAADGDPVTVSTERGSITLPALVTDMPDDMVWLPTNSPGSTVRRTLGPVRNVQVSL